MATINSSEFKNGLKVMIDGDPYVVVDHNHVRPGKGQAFHRMRIRNLKTGRVVERTYKSGESLESADIMETDVQYLYNDGEAYHFMDPASFEQYAIPGDTLEGTRDWLKENDTCILMLFNGAPLSVTPPNFVELKVTETDPGLRGDTSGGGSKPATLETGAVVRVPLFINEGDVLRIDTRTGDYVSRA